VLACEYENFEVIVVDQSIVSTGPPVPGDKRLRYITSGTRGKCQALNYAIGESAAEILLFTDDDCAVPGGWIARHLEVLTGDPEIQLVFGALRAAPHDPSRTLIPEFDPPEFARQNGGWAFLGKGGAGANLAVRRSVFDKVGLFDTRFGPGSPIPGCEEYDFYCRSLWAGFTAAFDPQNAVSHFGERSYSDNSALLLMRGYAFSEGAVLGKHLRSGNLRAGVGIVVICAHYASYSVKSIWKRRRRGAARPFDFLRGAAVGFSTIA